MVNSLECPKCRESVEVEGLERHLRQELRYLPWQCLLCHFHFLSAAEAERHFSGRFSRHKGHDPAIQETIDDAIESELQTLLRAADQTPPFSAAEQPDADHSGSSLANQTQPLQIAPGDSFLQLTTTSGSTSEESLSISVPSTRSHSPDMSLSDDEVIGGETDLVDLTGREEGSDGAEFAFRVADEEIDEPLPESEPESQLYLLSPDQEDAGFPYIRVKTYRIQQLVCQICGTEVYPEGPQAHMLNGHYESPPLRCSLCPFVARNLCYFQKHSHSKHPGKIEQVRQAKAWRKSHVLELRNRYLTVKEGTFFRFYYRWLRMQCYLCHDVVSSTKLNGLRQHILKNHLDLPFLVRNIRVISLARFVRRDSDISAYRHLLQRCFPGLPDLLRSVQLPSMKQQRPRRRTARAQDRICRLCGVVPAQHQQDHYTSHVARQHFTGPARRCPFCRFLLGAGRSCISAHFRNSHDLSLDDASIRAKDTFLPEFRQRARQCFPDMEYWTERETSDVKSKQNEPTRSGHTSCPICGYQFPALTTMLRLRLHIREIHADQPAASCRLCPRSFTNFNRALNHAKQDHPLHLPRPRDCLRDHRAALNLLVSHLLHRFTQ